MLTYPSSDHLFVITGPMQSAGGEGGGEEGREESSSREERDSKLQDGSGKATRDCRPTAPPAQEVLYLRNTEATFFALVFHFSPLTPLSTPYGDMGIFNSSFAQVL